ncbi:MULTISPECIES: efflux RND transporter periplasmic adaptor subunit [Paraburkholderia]|uniref:Efflux RND transporter periplasmic adaptor subunit n=1 Tax=Paraburkholderia madseniana TaxID=2599607 RepID=A0AAP5BAI8_9BURK|nr:MULTISPECIES: efflux RND transporter periplasmic adaptor subunit [Paraburkholderia]MCX4145040.1 efflux RND transporter periplasmic adaptor subunit [Paraburkholderia madseniana]MDN7147992.1 efflux RND transporter periplasmic adaptor subunit [Paraburkholderia sp. WS6]MDQ6406872.1 efflux RND transporter periplasmic adaptor subunit [Paraburkholderia madseniana]
MPSKRKLVAASAISLAIVAGVAAIYQTFGGESVTSSVAAAAPPAAEVDVAAVISQSITDYQTYSGRIEAINYVQIRPLVSGTIVAVHFRDGATVNKGDLLFTIDPRPYQAEVDRAAAQLASAEARNGYASTDWARAQRLLTDNAIAKRDYDEAQNADREALSAVKAARAALETARINLGYTSVTAPVSGRVSRAELTVGNVVSIGANAPVMTTLVSMSPIYASFDVDEQTYLRFLSHDTKTTVPVRIGLANETGFSRQGVIDSVDNRLDTSSGTIRVRARFDNADGVLVPGLYARVRVGGGAPHQAVLVSDAAIQTDQEKKFVLLVDKENKVQYREVKLGEQHEGLRAISDGLQPGDRIVVNGMQRVRPNDAVKPNLVQMSGDAATTKGSS